LERNTLDEENYMLVTLLVCWVLWKLIMKFGKFFRIFCGFSFET
jgi:hypothetical protein